MTSQQACDSANCAAKSAGRSSAWAERRRNRLLPRSGEVTASNAATLDRVFGSSAWREAVYPSSPSLFGDMNLPSDDGPRALLDVYVTGLRRLFRFVAPPRLVRTPAGLPLYYLIGAGPKEAGFRIAKHILEQGEHVEVDAPTSAARSAE